MSRGDRWTAADTTQEPVGELPRPLTQDRRRFSPLSVMAPALNPLSVYFRPLLKSWG